MEGDEVGGRPVAGAVSPDGRQLHLLVAQPYDADPDALVALAADRRRRRDGHPARHRDRAASSAAPLDRVAADFAEDAGSFVVWDDDTSTPSGTLVQLADGRQVPIPVLPGHSGSRGFRAYPGGVPSSCGTTAGSPSWTGTGPSSRRSAPVNDPFRTSPFARTGGGP